MLLRLIAEADSAPYLEAASRLLVNCVKQEPNIATELVSSQGAQVGWASHHKGRC